MRYSKKGAVLAAGVASVVMLGSTAAYANHTVVTVGGVGSPAVDVPVTGENINDPRNAAFNYAANAVSFDTNFGVPMDCETSDVTGQVHRGASVSVDTAVGEISSLTFSDCTATALGFDVVVTMTAQDIVVRDHPTNAGDPVPVDIQVDANITGVGCDFDASGSVRGEIIPGDSTNDGYIELQEGYDLVIDRAGTSGSSCGGEIWEGDLAQATTGIFALNTSGPNAGVISHG